MAILSSLRNLLASISRALNRARYPILFSQIPHQQRIYMDSSTRILRDDFAFHDELRGAERRWR